MIRSLSRWGAPLLALLLTACASGGGAPPRYYVMTPIAGSEAGATPLPTLSLEVAPVRIPQYLERPQIVTRSESNRLELAEYHQWGGNLRKDLTRLLMENLAALLGTADVAVAPRRGSGEPTLRVAVEVLRFERGPDGSVRLSAQWQLLSGHGDTPLESRITELRSKGAVPAGDYDAMVAAMSRLYGDLSRVIAGAIRSQLGAGHTGMG